MVEINANKITEVPEDKRTPEICMAAVTKNGRLLKHVPLEIITHDMLVAAKKHLTRV
jgi:hypothetical protein